MEERVIEDSSLDADPVPPEGPVKAGGNRIQAGQRIRQDLLQALVPLDKFLLITHLRQAGSLANTTIILTLLAEEYYLGDRSI